MSFPVSCCNSLRALSKRGRKAGRSSTHRSAPPVASEAVKDTVVVRERQILVDDTQHLGLVVGEGSFQVFQQIPHVVGGQPAVDVFQVFDKEANFPDRVVIGKGLERAGLQMIPEGRVRRHAQRAQPDEMRVDGFQDARRLQRVFTAPLHAAEARHDVFRQGHARFFDLDAGLDVLGGAHSLIHKLQDRIGSAFQADVNAVQSGVPDFPKFFHALSSQRGAAPVRRDTSDAGDFFLKITQRLHKIGRPQDGAVGVLQKDCSLPVVKPDRHMTVATGLGRVGEDAVDDLAAHLAGFAHGPRQRLDVVYDGADRVDIGLDFGQRPAAERATFINRAKGATVPRAIPRKPQKQTAGFARRPDRPLLEMKTHG